ncbi:hypothetical protein GCM10010215_09450 [Streptomyces virginiae]|uniref:Uncharacterized protein n=1 Tax=Streptomyces virginiae TaxID=1961 RepID=A0ABQ3NSF5_STRVG|nr:hypothetical protein GCM10010215_09450 [Streptomyces virginiae]GHI15712.1 hypothetical protein Scinn_51750 [Streptomyces virginiae]GLV89447.1 hypothetical protein Slala04_09010 [Streptomyces lavendulae subsp. lavendulae]
MHGQRAGRPTGNGPSDARVEAASAAPCQLPPPHPPPPHDEDEPQEEDDPHEDDEPQPDEPPFPAHQLLFPRRVRRGREPCPASFRTSRLMRKTNNAQIPSTTKTNSMSAPLSRPGPPGERDPRVPREGGIPTARTAQSTLEQVQRLPAG